MEYSTAAKLAQLPVKGKSPRRIIGSRAQRASQFALSDIHKVMVGRHGGSTYDPAWTYKYLEAALPHIVATRINWRESVRAWILQHVPVIAIMEDDAWIDAQTADCASRGKACGRRRNENDRIAKLLCITDDEVKAFGLCSIQAAKRTKAVRKRERKETNTAAHSDARRKAGAKPHSESAEQTKPWLAEGISRTRWYDLKAAKKLEESTEVEGKTAVLDRFVRNITVEPEKVVPGQIRPQHIFYRQTPVLDFQGIPDNRHGNPQSENGSFICYGVIPHSEGAV